MAIVQLDHIVILLPYADIVNPPSWLTDHFTIAPGGRHGDNKTENKLIIFADGSYLELISFIDDNPDLMNGHWWGDKGWGIIDYAFTLKEGSSAFSEVQKRIQSLEIPDDWKPQDLRSGSRLKPDGERIEWQVGFPQAGARGKVPFWCFDVTPRERRVPMDEKWIIHPSGAKGIEQIHIQVDERFIKGCCKMLDAISPNKVHSDNSTWRLAPVNKSDNNEREIVVAINSSGPIDESYQSRGFEAKLRVFTDTLAGEGQIRQQVHQNMMEISIGKG